MKLRLFELTILAALIGFSSERASAIEINFATGQNPAGTISYTNATQDVHWTLTSGGINPLNAPNVYVVAPIVGEFGSCCPAWLANGPNSSWIAPNPIDLYGNGDFVVSYQFNLAATYLATAVFSGGLWSIDDGGYLKINGNQISSLQGGWDSLHPFSIPVAYLVQGVNTLSIVSQNSDRYLEAVRLEGTLTVTATPIPAALPLFATGLGVMGLLGWWKKRKDAAAV